MFIGKSYRHSLSVIVQILLLSNLLSSQTPKQRSSNRVVNLMPAFWRYEEQARDLDRTARAKLFRELVMRPNNKVFDGFTGKADDARITKYLEEVEPYIPGMRRLSEQLNNDSERYVRSFKKKFRNADKTDGTIYFMPNLLGGWDAGGGNLDGQAVLVFGIDSIVRLHGDNANLAILFHHELFHMYHNQLHPEWKNKSREKGEIPLYWLFWTEGLATYVSRVLNPKSDEAEVLLSKTLAAESTPRIAQLARGIRENLDSTATDTFMNYLSGTPKDKSIPNK